LSVIKADIGSIGDHSAALKITETQVGDTLAAICEAPTRQLAAA
jgi:hypothetical protein